MAAHLALFAAFGPWKLPRSDKGEAERSSADAAGVLMERRLTERIGEVNQGVARFARHHDLLLVDMLDIAGLLAALDVACRDQDWACGLCLNPPSNLRFTALRMIDLARRSPWGIAVRRDPADPAVAPVRAALALHVSILRERRPAAWRAIDALHEHGTRRDAGAALGISQQAISNQLRRARTRATDCTGPLLSALLPSPTPNDVPGSSTSPKSASLDIQPPAVSKSPIFIPNETARA